jgi:hypothetical protein
VRGEVVDDEGSTGTSGNSNGARIWRVDLRRSPAIDGAIEAV